MMQGFYLLARQQQRRRIAAVCAACVLALTSAGLAVRSHYAAAVPVAAAPMGYIARIGENDRLVVYREGADVPLVRTSIDTRTLPQADRDALAAGVPLADAAALARLLEDYGS